MNYLPRSHLNNKINHIETFDKNSDLTRGQEIDLSINNNEIVPVILKKGQASLHHCLLPHGAGPNLTNLSRIGAADFIISLIIDVSPSICLSFLAQPQRKAC